MYENEREPKKPASAVAMQEKPAVQRKASATSAADSGPVAAKGISAVREALLAHFRDVFVPSARFQETFGGKSWSDVKGEVLADVERFGLDGEVFRDPDGRATYTGRVWSLYTEVTVAPGAAPSVYVEID